MKYLILDSYETTYEFYDSEVNGLLSDFMIKNFPESEISNIEVWELGKKKSINFSLTDEVET
jgi:hypothetical protein